jgi:hypothetical protein
MSERLLIVRFGEWPRSRRAWPLHTNLWAGPMQGRKSAGAAFRRVDGAWRCVRAVPALALWTWLSMEDIQRQLEEKGLRWEWARRFDL